MKETGNVGAIYFGKVQVGAFGSPSGKYKWTFEEIISALPGSENVINQKLTGWKASCGQYIFWYKQLRKAKIKPADIKHCVFKFLFARRIAGIEAVGTITTNDISVGEPATTGIRMGGEPPIRRMIAGTEGE